MEDDRDSNIFLVSRTVSGAGSSLSSTPNSSPEDLRFWKGLLILASTVDVGTAEFGELDIFSPSRTSPFLSTTDTSFAIVGLFSTVCMGDLELLGVYTFGGLCNSLLGGKGGGSSSSSSGSILVTSTFFALFEAYMGFPFCPSL